MIVDCSRLLKYDNKFITFLTFSSLHKLTISESHNPVYVISFKCCCDLPLVLLNGQLGEMHICYRYIAHTF